MSVTAPATRRWETREYTRIASVRFRAPTLFVGFGDGSEVGVAVERFDNPAILSQAPEWSRARAAVHEVLVPTATGEIGIPWDSIRALTDAEFAAHWADMTDRVARDVGARLRAWREEQHLDPAAVARAAGVPVAIVLGAEAGRDAVDPTLLDRLVAAMGHDPADLIDTSELDASDPADGGGNAEGVRRHSGGDG